MSNTIQSVTFSDDFEADVLLASPAFLQQYNPEMVWASKGFLFIRINPSFHLDEESLRLMNADFGLFRMRLELPDNSFKREVLGRVMQIFLFDLWTVCQHGLSQMETSDRSAFGRSLPPGRENTARIFLRFLSLVQQHELGPVMYFIDTAGASPNQANPEHIVDLDMVGTGYAVDAFGEVMAEGGAGLIISSQAAYMYPIPNDVELQLVRTPTEILKNVPFIKIDGGVIASIRTGEYQLG